MNCKLETLALSLLLLAGGFSAQAETEKHLSFETNHHVEVYAGVSGYSDVLTSSSFTGYSASIAAAFFLTQSDLLLVEYTGGTYQTSTLGGCAGLFNSGCAQESGHLSTESLLYQHFYESSFFTKVGGATSQANYSYTSSSNSFTQTAYDQNYYAVFGVGNEWHIHHFTLGFDWARIYIPLGNSAYNETDTGNGGVNYSDLNKRMNSTRLEYLHAYFGANF